VIRARHADWRRDHVHAHVTPHHHSANAGFALLGVLWIIIGLSVMALAMARVSWHAVTVAEIEHDQITGRWLAEGCLARLRSVTNSVLANDPPHAPVVWRALDTVLLTDSAAALTGCDLTVRTDGRIVLDRALPPELDTLPGMTPEAIARVLQRQETHTPMTDLVVIESALSPAAKALFDAHYAELLRMVTVEPDAWVVRARVDIGAPPTPVNVEARLVRAGSRAAVMRWVEW
jgi:hypothetical protein